MEELATLLQRHETRWASTRERSPAAAVVAVIELRETRRKWLVVGSEVRDGQHVLVGYEPRCRYDGPGNGWFTLSIDFFVSAARATGDHLDVHTLGSTVTVEELDIDEPL